MLATQRSYANGIVVALWAVLIGWGLRVDPTVSVEMQRPPAFGQVDNERLRHADREPGQWFTGGRDAGGTYFSPLSQINESNLERLGFAWEYRTGTYRGLEATPIVVDRVLYTSGNGGAVYALDATSGKELWTFRPDNDWHAARAACCDTVNRGLAVRNGRVYVASLDGRLFALDARTGAVVWVQNSFIDKTAPYSITGAPQLTKDLVVIGNGGADMGQVSVRGYVSAYDQVTGQLRWRFFTVPEVDDRQPTPDMALAAKTWDVSRNRRYRGGGTVWDGMAYDADADLLYIGVGNSGPYQRRDRSPRGGDNLFVSSIVAIHADTGRMAWYYQTTPGDNWDYTATQKMVLADLRIKGESRKVILQAPKNGYFYVIDRLTGKVISAEPYTYINWSHGMDASFRPIIDAQADYSQSAKLIFPSWAGGHSWQPMSYNPRTGLVYLPVLEAPMIMGDLATNRGAALQRFDGTFETFMLIPDSNFDRTAFAAIYGDLPDPHPPDGQKGKHLVSSTLKAWDPVKQRVVWSQKVADSTFSVEGGAMSTAGNLVFQGTSSGELRVYAADSGRLLRSIATGSAIMAAPATYLVDGTQYVTFMAGYGGSGVGNPFPPASAPARYENAGRIIALRLGGADRVPTPDPRVALPFPKPPAQTATATDIRQGQLLFMEHCARCHQFGVGLMPDLRRMEAGVQDIAFFKHVVLDGLFTPKGMGKFDDVLSAADVERIHAYLIGEAQVEYAAKTH